MQYQLPLMCVLKGPQKVPDEVVNQWQSLHDALSWSFAQRDNPGAKSKKWIAENLQMRAQHVTRLLSKRDLKLDPIQSHMWDCLTGWTACDQYTQVQKRQIADAASEQVQEIMRRRFAV